MAVSETDLASPDGELGAYTILLLAISALLGQAALHQTLPTDGLIYDIIFTSVFLACVYVMSRQDRRTMRWAILFGVPTVAAQWTSSYQLGDAALYINLAFVTMFLGFTTLVTLRSVLTAETVKLDVILGSVAGYLLISLVFTMLFMGMEHTFPGSFVKNGEAISVEASRNLAPDLIYFSLVTITTLGYGDITPTTEISRLVSVIEAVVGQLYIAILIAGLVGRRLAQGRGPL